MKKIPVAVLGIVAALALAFAVSAPPRAFSSGTPITGWAWSANIGWVSLNCSNTDGVGCTSYGFSTDGSGNINGYAWGENIGWISSQQDANVCGPHARVDGNGNLTGWLKALNTGGDGCISLSGPGYQATTQSNPNYATYADAAWGSDTVGWLVFNAAGGQCVPTFSCNGGGNAVNSCNGAVQTCTNGCTEPTGCSPGPTYTGCISVNSNTCSPAQKRVLVRKGSTASVYWNVTNVSSCTITGSDGESWTGRPATGTATTTAITAAVTLRLFCDSGIFTDQAVINISPVYKEI